MVLACPESGPPLALILGVGGRGVVLVDGGGAGGGGAFVGIGDRV